ncbi:ABC-F family ATP-binding cassette domain-containing protein [Polluticoccus soli]|uniref:ABC-F family ATP-binding cassette domain-containing protein n=1 Tax=Polluticoccus soli TaxID=3034150 RepID=UPI0023E34C8B|nr:ABC-F family ATP-binding cassette domain-containing protein [Flavipsychrobacter sp. JY13-12]
MLILQGVRYAHPNGDILFNDLNLSIGRTDKAALVGNNGAGKSTLLQLLAGQLLPLQGTITANTKPYYVPQHFGQYNQLTIAEALGVSNKLLALHEILAGNVTEHNMTTLDDDWTIEERCAEALAHWQLSGFSLDKKLDTLSGGEKTKVFLAGMEIHRPEIVLMDEPTNHLDLAARKLLYEYITTTNVTLVVVSHDRTLLNLLSHTYELSKQGIATYGGNYEFYAEQKAIEQEAFNAGLKSKEKELRKAKQTERETIERQQKLDARGKNKQEKSGVPTIMMNTLRNSAEKSTARIKDVHADKISGISDELNSLRKQAPAKDKMKLGFDDSQLHKGKILVQGKDINLAFNDRQLWQTPISLTITSGQRLAIKGNNGSGKTTLVQVLLGQMQPTTGSVELADFSYVYIDQDYSLVDNSLTVYEQAQTFNSENLEEHEVKSRLTHFLFTAQWWDKPCSTLSGGEKMRLMLCCLSLGTKQPDMIILDEPTNNLDMQNVDILTEAINDYKGTLIVISHDEHFLQLVDIQQEMAL